MLQNSCVFLDWTNWTFWVTAVALVAFGFCLRDIYEQWRFRKVRKAVRDEFHEVNDLTRRLQAATERLNKANNKAAGLGIEIGIIWRDPEINVYRSKIGMCRSA